MRKLVAEGVIALVVGIAAATLTYYLGKSKGAEEQKTQFDQIATQVNLNKTKWEVSYEDIDPPNPNSSSASSKGRKPNSPATAEASPSSIRVATLEFKQVGSRILGEGRDLSGRRWIVEGVAAERRVCYIYFDPEGRKLSMGTVLVALDNSGTLMTGQWLGWSPESNELHPRKIILKRIN